MFNQVKLSSEGQYLITYIINLATCNLVLILLCQGETKWVLPWAMHEAEPLTHDSRLHYWWLTLQQKTECSSAKGQIWFRELCTWFIHIWEPTWCKYKIIFNSNLIDSTRVIPNQSHWKVLSKNIRMLLIREKMSCLSQSASSNICPFKTTAAYLLFLYLY